MLGRVTALLIRDLGRSRVNFLALARGQELVVSTLISRMMVVYGHGSMGIRGQAFERTKHIPRNMVNR
jgi:hypothetical protein